MQLIVDLLDSLSPLVTVGFGIYGATNDTKPKDGKLTRQGKIAIIGIVISGLVTLTVKSTGLYVKMRKQKTEIQALKTQDSLRRAQDSVRLDFQDSVAKSFRASLEILDAVSRKTDTSINVLNGLTEQQILTYDKTNWQILRAYYPLQPISLHYTIEYPIDQDEFRDYAMRVKPLILKNWQETWGGDRFKSSYLDTGFYARSNNLGFKESWLPQKHEEERGLRSELLDDHTSFDFVGADQFGQKHLTFLSVPNGYENVYLGVPYKEKPRQEISLGIDFENKKITKRVSSYNPIRAGNDLLPISSVDLIGRVVKWESIEMKSTKWRLTELEIKFSYDYLEQSSYDDQGPPRKIIVKKGTRAVKIKPQHVGLRGEKAD